MSAFVGLFEWLAECSENFHRLMDFLIVESQDYIRSDWSDIAATAWECAQDTVRRALRAGRWAHDVYMDYAVWILTLYIPFVILMKVIGTFLWFVRYLNRRRRRPAPLKLD